MAGNQQPRLRLPHVIAHDGSPGAQRAYETSRVISEEVVLLLAGATRPKVSPAGPVDAVGALTIDRVLRTARDSRAPYVTVPASLVSPERALLSTLDAVARLATAEWPAVAVQVMQQGETPGTEVVVIATDGRTSGSTLLAASFVAAVSGASLTAVVTGGVGNERVKVGVRRADADLGFVLRERYGVATHYARLERDADAATVQHVLSKLDPRWVVVGLGQIAPGISHRDLTREGRRRLLAGPLRVEHLALRAGSSDAIIVADSARLRRRAAREESVGLGTYFTGDFEHLDSVVEEARRLREQRARGEGQQRSSAEVGDVDSDPGLLGSGEQGAVETIESGPGSMLAPFDTP